MDTIHTPGCTNAYRVGFPRSAGKVTKNHLCSVGYFGSGSAFINLFPSDKAWQKNAQGKMSCTGLPLESKLWRHEQVYSFCSVQCSGYCPAVLFKGLVKCVYSAHSVDVWILLGISIADTGTPECIAKTRKTRIDPKSWCSLLVKSLIATFCIFWFASLSSFDSLFDC